ncbi:unnamed protein product [Phytophthora fragariaefolia]|uniref:Unnamed protein product n=1 Tax=Phytophthora fragariaefolia TaxID=1490495 RepID=A0A9W6XPD6_9STRA|nr:unnamed protein product [Phytophthora fragariaefolia]
MRCATDATPRLRQAEQARSQVAGLQFGQPAQRAAQVVRFVSQEAKAAGKQKKKKRQGMSENELAQKKSQTKCSNCRQPGHWYAECTAVTGMPLKLELTDKLKVKNLKLATSFGGVVGVVQPNRQCPLRWQHEPSCEWGNSPWRSARHGGSPPRYNRGRADGPRMVNMVTRNESIRSPGTFGEWILDPGSQANVCNDLSLFTSLSDQTTRQVSFDNGTVQSAVVYGSVLLRVCNQVGKLEDKLLENVMYISNLQVNVISLLHANGEQIQGGLTTSVLRGYPSLVPI